MGADDQTEAVQRRFEVLYLDESARIVRFLPDADSDSEPQLFVFEREGAESLMDEVGAHHERSCAEKITIMISATAKMCIGVWWCCRLHSPGRRGRICVRPWTDS